MGEMSKALKIGIGLTFVAVVLSVIALAIPYWWCTTQKNNGLFKVCANEGGCMKHKPVLEWVESVRAMIILSFLALTACFVLSMLIGFYMKEKDEVELLGFTLKNKPKLTFVAAILSFLAAILGIIGISITAAEVADMGGADPCAGFYLEIVAVLGAVAAGVFLYRFKKELESQTSRE